MNMSIAISQPIGVLLIMINTDSTIFKNTTTPLFWSRAAAGIWDLQDTSSNSCLRRHIMKLPTSGGNETPRIPVSYINYKNTIYILSKIEHFILFYLKVVWQCCTIRNRRNVLFQTHVLNCFVHKTNTCYILKSWVIVKQRMKATVLNVPLKTRIIVKIVHQWKKNQKTRKMKMKKWSWVKMNEKFKSILKAKFHALKTSPESKAYCTSSFWKRMSIYRASLTSSWHKVLLEVF